MSDKDRQTALYNALVQALGEEPASTLMERTAEHRDLVTREDLLTLESSLREEIRVGYDKIDDRFEKIEDRFEKIEDRFEKIEDRFEKIEDRFHDFHEALRGYARTFVVAQTATVFGVAALVLGIARLW